LKQELASLPQLDVISYRFVSKCRHWNGQWIVISN